MPRQTGNAILNDVDIPDLRKRLRTNQTTPKEEADRFGVGIETIRRAARGETFRHIREGLPEEDTPTPSPIVAPAPPPPAPLSPELADEVAESIRRVQESVRAPAEQRDAVEDFLSIRKESDGGKKE